MTNRSKRVALVDGDIIAYRCAASCLPTKAEPDKREEAFVAKGRAADICNRIGDKCQADELRIFISGTGNFRYSLYPDYKANRRNVPKPEHLGAVQQFLVRKWGAVFVDGMEADDAIGIAATEDIDFTVCSIDKDLLQIPGNHFNFVKNEHRLVDPETAAYNLYSLMLIGDTSDNVRGVEGIGPVNARRILDGKSPEEQYMVVQEYYEDENRFHLNHRLLSVLRSDEEYQKILGEIDENKQCQAEREEVTTDDEGYHSLDIHGPSSR